MSRKINISISPALVKSKYLKCLESKFINFYPSKRALIPLNYNSRSTPTPFEVRYCPALLSKKAEVSVGRICSAPTLLRNPFLPFDQNLLVSEFESYAVIFNKFCVIPEHLLIITRKFVEQATEYSREDFGVVGEVLDGLREVNPLAFYNSGPAAGASQSHRHFQVIPNESIPIEEHVEKFGTFNVPFLIPLYSSFRHGCIRKPIQTGADPNWHFEAYQKLKTFCGFEFEAFNLVWTQDWMLLVPRRKEFTDDQINSLNAMAFAGYFLVMDERHLEQFSPVECLEQVTFPVSV